MDITFTKDNMRFKYRASALIIENNHILLQIDIMKEFILEIQLLNEN